MFNKKYICVLLITVIAIPVVINLLFLAPIFDWGGGDDNGWLGFWGSYLGIIVSAAGVYITYKQHVQDNERKSIPYFSFKFMSDIDESDKKKLKIVYNQELTQNNEKNDSKSQITNSKKEIKNLVNDILKNNIQILVCRAKIKNPITEIYVVIKSIALKGTRDGAKETKIDYYYLDWIDNGDILSFVTKSYMTRESLGKEIAKDISEITISYLDYMGIRRYTERTISKENGISTILSENFSGKIKNDNFMNEYKETYSTVITNFNDLIK